jgi:hypothetical protein
MEMASWFHVDEGYIFLTDEDIIAWHENQGAGTTSINWNDFVGHGGISKVFGVNHSAHHEGFVGMPDVVRKTILDGKMDMMFAHATNLCEATPEFINMMKRLANRYPNVESQLVRNPYLNHNGQALTVLTQMEVGVKNKFVGSTVGKLIRHPMCKEDAMLVALKGATEFMDEQPDHHHYRDIITHPNITRKVLKYIKDNIKHSDVQGLVKQQMKTFKARNVIKKIKAFKKLEVKVVTNGKVKVRSAV